MTDTTDNTPPQTPPPGNERLVPVNIEEEMRASFLDYAMSVIVGRALPDVRDGLKPVHRRVLYAMHELSNTYNRAYKKSARIVGDVIGKYHPHGDQAVYDTIVRMAQDFSMRHVLIDGQGNFGSVDGDPPAAMRYTEIRMARLTGEMLADIEKETVDFAPNYDDTQHEPVVLPTRFPNLLINGSTGIAVGMATNIPPHNLAEVIDAALALIKNPALSIPELMQFIPGPDFPTAGIIYGAGGLRSAYETGRGSIKVRGKTHIEQMKGNRERIVVTELPYQVNKATLLERIAEMVRDKKLEGISDLRDESNREGMRMVIELKRDATPEVVFNQLYANTALQSSFGFNVVALVEGQPRILSLKELLEHFLDHRREVVTRRSRFELREARKRFNVVYGLLSAIDSIDRVISIIRAAPDAAVAKVNLMAEKLPMSPAFIELTNRLVTFDYDTGKQAIARGHMRLNEEQAQAILDMRLSRLTGLERDKLAEEAEQLRDAIEKLLAILGSYERLMQVISQELEDVKKTYSEPRRTVIEATALDIADEDLIVDEDMVVTRSHSGYVKRVPPSTYRAQNRGGRGKTAAATRDDDDFIEQVFVASMRSYVLAFTDKGRVYWVKVHSLPTGAGQARGKPIANLVKLQEGERVRAFLPVREFKEGSNIVFVTKKGTIKKTDIMQYANPRPSGIIALGIEDGDELVFVGVTNGTDQIFIATREGQAVRFQEKLVRNMGRSAYGVRGVKFKKKDDEVVGAVIPQEGQVILTVTEGGFGKRTPLAEYRETNRGTSGVVNCKITDRNGKVAMVLGVLEDDHIMVVTDRGIMIRMVVNQIRQTGRASQGVRVIALNTGEKVTSVTRLEDKDESALTAPLAVDEAELKAIEAEDAAAAAEEVIEEDAPADDDGGGEPGDN